MGSREREREIDNFWSVTERSPHRTMRILRIARLFIIGGVNQQPVEIVFRTPLTRGLLLYTVERSQAARPCSLRRRLVGSSSSGSAAEENEPDDSWNAIHRSATQKITSRPEANQRREPGEELFSSPFHSVFLRDCLILPSQKNNEETSARKKRATRLVDRCFLTARRFSRFFSYME